MPNANIRASIFLKNPAGPPHAARECQFTLEVWAELQRDWLGSNRPDLPKVGAYKCRVLILRIESGQPSKSAEWHDTEILIRFGEVAFIG